MLFLLTGIALTLPAAFALAWLLPLRRLTDRLVAGALFAPAFPIVAALALSAPGPYFTRVGALVCAAVETSAVVTAFVLSPTARYRLRRDLGRAAAGARALPREAIRHPLVTAVLVVVAALTAWRALVGIVIEVRDYDGLWYHLTKALAIVHDHRIGPRIPFNIYADGYAENIQILSGWTVLLRGTTQFTSTLTVPFAVLGGLVVAAMARRCGLRRSAALVAAALFLLTPSIIDQFSRAYNDVTIAMLQLSGLHMAAVVVVDRSLNRREQLAYTAVAGTALGLALGSKASSLFTVAVSMLFIAVGLVLAVRRDRSGALIAGAAGAGCVVMVALLGGVYYVRDAILFGNPLYPFTFDLGPIHWKGPLELGKNLVAPFMPKGMEHLSQPEIVFRMWSGALEEKGWLLEHNFGQQWLVLWPVMLLVLVYCLARFRSAERYRYFALTGATLLAAVLLQPVGWWGRYTSYVVAAAAIAFMWVVEAIRVRGRWPAVTAYAALAALLVVVVMPLDRFIPTPVGLAASPFGPGTGRMVSATQILDSVGTSTLTIWNDPLYRWLRQVPPGSTIGATTRAPYFLAPLYGRDGSNAVVLVETQLTAGGHAAFRDFDYLYVGVNDPVNRYAQQRPDCFRRISGGNSGVVYQVTAQQCPKSRET